MNVDQIAHDLAMAYVLNRHGAEVLGEFSVYTDSANEVTGSGAVRTERLANVDKVRMVKVGTGERQLFGLVEKKRNVEAGFEVDPTFEAMIKDYYGALARFTELLNKR